MTANTTHDESVAAVPAWTRIEDGGAPVNQWVLVAVEHLFGCPPFVVQAYWDKGPIPRWRTWGLGELPPEAVVVAWHPMPELPYDMMHVAIVTER